MEHHHIFFKVGLAPKEDCWGEGYLNSGNVGTLHSLVVNVSKGGLKLLSASNGVTQATFEPLSDRFDRFELADRLSEFYQLESFILAEILFIGSDPSNAVEDLSDEGLVVVRQGEDFGSEINLSEFSFRPKEKKAMRVVFGHIEKGKFGSGDIDEKSSFAALFVPAD